MSGWGDAARHRMLELRRHPGHDGPTVCACTECVLWALLETALEGLSLREQVAKGTVALAGGEEPMAEYLRGAAEPVKVKCPSCPYCGRLRALGAVSDGREPYEVIAVEQLARCVAARLVNGAEMRCRKDHAHAGSHEAVTDIAVYVWDDPRSPLLRTQR